MALYGGAFASYAGGLLFAARRDVGVPVLAPAIILLLVNVANATLAGETGSRRWVSVLAAAACLGALGVMVLQIAFQPEHRHALWLILGVAVVPFVYESTFRLIAAQGGIR